MERIEGWRPRNGMMIADNPPHKEVNLTPLKDGSIWKHPSKPKLARWTSNFDCGYETEWYYVIKDTPFDLASMKSKHRYDVTRGNKHYDVKIVDPMEYLQELFEVTEASFTAYPEEYRPVLIFDQFRQGMSAEENHVLFAAFDKETGKIEGYLGVNELSDYIRASTLKVNPACEKYYINDALIAAMLQYFSNKIEQGQYLEFGERNVSHKTKIYDKIIRQYGFRKAYCHFNVAYNGLMKIGVNVAYPFKNLLAKNKTNKLISKVNSLLAMEDIARACKKKLK